MATKIPSNSCPPRQINLNILLLLFIEGFLDMFLVAALLAVSAVVTDLALAWQAW